MRESQSGTAFQAGRDGGISLSEGILSFVEYAPRLLIVLPSRQFRTRITWVILLRHRRTKGGSKSRPPLMLSEKHISWGRVSRPQLYVIGQAFEADGVTKRDAIKRNTYSQAAFPNWEHRSSLQSLVLRHRRSKGGDKTSTPSNQRPESGRWYLQLLTLPCNTGCSN